MRGSARCVLAALRLVSCLAPPAAAFLSTAPPCPAACAPHRRPWAPRCIAAEAAEAWVQHDVLGNKMGVKHDVLGNKMGVLTLDRPKALNAADKSVTGRPAAQLMVDRHIALLAPAPPRTALTHPIVLLAADRKRGVCSDEIRLRACTHAHCGTRGAPIPAGGVGEERRRASRATAQQLRAGVLLRGRRQGHCPRPQGRQRFANAVYRAVE